MVRRKVCIYRKVSYFHPWIFGFATMSFAGKLFQ
jgi:hypothetical protein